MLKLYAIFERPALRRAFVKICEDARLRTIVDEIARLPQASWRPDSATAFASDEAQLLGELREFGRCLPPALACWT